MKSSGYPKAILLLFFNLLLLTACGGGGGGGGSSGTTTPPSLNITPNMSINATTSHDLHTAPFRVDRTAVWSYGIPNALAYADIDGDGDKDIFDALGSITWDPVTGNATPTDMRMYRNNAGIASLDTGVWGGTIPTGFVSRKALTGDYNGDGIPDFVVIDSGYDASPFPGAAPVVLLSNAGSGTYTKATGLDTLIGYHHGGASGDIDNDGDIDIFLTDGGNNVGYPMFLINDGTGHFTVNVDRMPSELFNGYTKTGLPFFSAELVDIDGDGFLDLQVGGVEPPSGTLNTTIYWGNSTGYYSSASKTVLPTVAGFTDQLDFDARDLDGDGDRDLLVTRTSHNYQGYSIQYLRNDGNRVFTDVTSSRITGSSKTTGNWIVWVSVGDANGDGFVDIYTETTDTFNNASAVWINDGSGNFVSSPASASTLPVISLP